MSKIKENTHARIAGILTGILLTLGAAMLLCWPEKPEIGEVSAEEVQLTPMMGPLAGWVILVDPGHGGYDGGARAKQSGVWEKEINLAVAMEVAQSLRQRGADVVMTRTEDVDLTSSDRPASQTKKRQDMQARVDLAVSSGADMVLSIHMNEYRSAGESGPQVFYRQGSESGRLLAGCLQEALIDTLQPSKKRAALAGDYFILQLDVPSALIECGFISNVKEEKLLLDGAYQSLVGEAVALGVEEYVRLQGESSP